MWQTLAAGAAADGGTDAASSDLPPSVWARFRPAPAGSFGVHEALQVLQAGRARSVAIYDTTGTNPLTDVSIVVTGVSVNHMRALADAVSKAARASTRPPVPHNLCFDVQGRDADDWMLVDLQQFVVHVFTADGRVHNNYVERRGTVDAQWIHNGIAMTAEEQAELKSQLQAALARFRSQQAEADQKDQAEKLARHEAALATRL